jgi:hypothetical protein
MMIDCPHRTETGCRRIDEGVGLPIVLHHDVCEWCTKTYPDAEAREAGYAVQVRIWGERNKRGLPNAGPLPRRPQAPTMASVTREHPRRPNIAEEMMAVARATPRATPAPVVPLGEDRLSICEECSEWRGERCVATCGGCKKRPRPMAETGRDCPLGKWRR